ncbi:MAG: hypothetical protein QOI10_3619 [Solirubrobacterales bacterium]|jgi:hypothetical protein|nr:hypothetical protein [Solirubrobacterales bacterium]
MLVVLVAAGGFVWWRVEYALDHRFDQDLASRTSDLQQAARRAAPAQALASLRDQGRLGQLVTADGTILASGAGLVGNGALLTPAQARQAAQHQLKTGRGYAGQLRICAPGHHHRRPTTSPDLAAVPCEHPESGTTLTLLWPVAQR